MFESFLYVIAKRVLKNKMCSYQKNLMLFSDTCQWSKFSTWGNGKDLSNDSDIDG